MPEPKPVVVIADGFLWTRDTNGSPSLDGPGDPIEANIALVRDRKAMVFTYIAKSLATRKAVTAWLYEYLPDAELYQGYGFPYGEVYADTVNGDTARVIASTAEALKVTQAEVTAAVDAAYQKGLADGKAAKKTKAAADTP